MVRHPLADIVVLVINPSPVQPAMFRNLQLKCYILMSANPPDLLLLVVLAVHSVIDHQLT